MGLNRNSIAFYYGPGQLIRLAAFDRVVLQPGHFGSEDLAWLRQRGTLTLAYLSLGQDAGEPMPWHTDLDNPEWGTRFVDVANPAWIARCVAAVRANLAAGFAGVFLDTLDRPLDTESENAKMLSLVRSVREAAGSAYLLANRGFSLFPELAGLVQGMVFESFSTTWTLDDLYCTVLPRDVLEHNSRIANALASFGIERYALDYAYSRQQLSFARARARLHGMSWSASNRSLTMLPDDLAFGNQTATSLDA